ncbi:MAG: FAD:protein FMN transferase [Candidatus Levybacteria bacterium]|nr:FAD:protein FMN transferase [Candidatus Levybacteria bacterium]
MKKIKILMGMPIIIEVVDKQVSKADINKVYSYFEYINQKFSTYKATSEITLINKGKIKQSKFSKDMKRVFKLSAKTKAETNGFFDIERSGKYDPSGLVKGWAIFNATKLLKKRGFKNFYINAGGDIQSFGKNKNGKPWTIGIRNPFKTQEVIKVINPKNKGVATSGTYERGNHIYSPKINKKTANDIVSLTVIGPNIYEADRFATAAFAMGNSGINFIENLPGFEGYMIDKIGIATYTSGFEKFVYENN